MRSQSVSALVAVGGIAVVAGVVIGGGVLVDRIDHNHQTARTAQAAADDARDLGQQIQAERADRRARFCASAVDMTFPDTAHLHHWQETNLCPVGGTVIAPTLPPVDVPAVVTSPLPGPTTSVTVTATVTAPAPTQPEKPPQTITVTATRTCLPAGIACG